MGENGETISDSGSEASAPSKKIIIQVTKPLSAEEIAGLTPQVRSDRTLFQKGKCHYSIFEPVIRAYASVNGGLMPRSSDVPDFEVPNPHDDITLDSRVEAYFIAAKMYHESEATEPNKDRGDISRERELAHEYEVAAEAVHRGVADPASTKILHRHLSDLLMVGGSSGADIMASKKYQYAEKISAMYEERFPLVEEKQTGAVAAGKAFFTSIAGRFGLKK